MKSETISSFATRLAQRIMAVLFLSMAAIAIVVYYVVQNGVSNEVEERYEGTLLQTREQLRDVLSDVSVAVENNVHDVERDIDNPDKMHEHVARMLRINPYLVGIGIMFQPDYYPSKGRWYEIYAVRDTAGSIAVKQIGSAHHDYLQAPWYTKAIKEESGGWSHPYFDELGAKQLLITYLSQIRDREGRIVGLIGADLSLEWLRHRMKDADERNNLKFASSTAQKAYSFIIDNNSTYIIHPDSSRILVGNFLNDTKTTPGDADDRLAFRMMAGEDSKEMLSIGNISSQIFFCPLEYVDWSMAIVVPQAAIYRNGRILGLIILTIILAGLALIYLISRYTIRRTSKPLTDYAAHAASVERELDIAQNIQMAMLPKEFDTQDLSISLHAILTPAKAVGGDLYDYFLRDNHLVFCIGDVSGKGVPAALMMAVMRAMFRSEARQTTTATDIVDVMNRNLCKEYTGGDFVTMFVGILDLQTGMLDYCNAGHEAPLLLNENPREKREACTALPIKSNLPVGALSDWTYEGQQEQLKPSDMLFLYTDGLSEANNTKGEQLGREHVLELASKHNSDTVQQLIEAMETEVHRHAAGAEQSDDVTMLALRWQPTPITSHLTMRASMDDIALLKPFIENVAQEAGMDDKEAKRLRLAVEEAVANVINYSRATGITLQATQGDDCVLLTIDDDGQPFDPTADSPTDLSIPADQRPPGGMGILLLHQMTDGLSYQRRDDHNILKIKKITIHNA